MPTRSVQSESSKREWSASGSFSSCPRRRALRNETRQQHRRQARNVQVRLWIGSTIVPRQTPIHIHTLTRTSVRTTVNDRGNRRTEHIVGARRPASTTQSSRRAQRNHGGEAFSPALRQLKVSHGVIIGAPSWTAATSSAPPQRGPYQSHSPATATPPHRDVRRALAYRRELDCLGGSRGSTHSITDCRHLTAADALPRPPGRAPALRAGRHRHRAGPAAGA